MWTTPLPPPSERKPVTVLVGGVEGLRTLGHVIAPETVDDVLNRGFALLVTEVHQVEGFLSQVAGHGFTALFGALLACEDHVLRALHAALRIQRIFEPLQSFQCAEEEIVLATQYGFALWRAGGIIVRGCALAMQGRRAEGMLQIREGSIAWQATGSDVAMPLFFFPLAKACGEEGSSKKRSAWCVRRWLR
jgi:hypothetical protein